MEYSWILTSALIFNLLPSSFLPEGNEALYRHRIAEGKSSSVVFTVNFGVLATEKRYSGHSWENSTVSIVMKIALVSQSL